MNAYRVVLLPAAKDDLRALRAYVHQHSSAQTAQGYIRRIRDFIASLANAPARGSIRSELDPNLRVIGFERRISVHFLVEEERVVVIAIHYAGSDWQAGYAGPS